MRSQKGFTVAELMIALAVTGITLSIGVPGFSDFVANQSQSNAANDLVSAMMLARSEAVKTNQFVTVCQSTDGLQCSAVVNWDTGWIVFANTARDNVDTVDATEVVIRSFEPSHSDREITPSDPALNFVTFSPTGTVSASATWVICDGRGDLYARAVFVDRAGRARAVEPDTPAAGAPGICD